MQIAFVGDLSIDINVVKGVSHTVHGGGALVGGVAAHHLGADTTIVTRCSPADRRRFASIEALGLRMVYRPGQRSTSIRNDYPTDDPDDRSSTFLSRAEPFTREDVEGIEADVICVNPLWMGQFPPDLLSAVRPRARLLAADAQGFLRQVRDDGSSFFAPWPGCERYLPLLDLLKVDANEARVLTGLTEPEPAVRALLEMGARAVLLTDANGVTACDGAEVVSCPFSPYSIEGRTGRGDTCTAAFLVSWDAGEIGPATRFAAAVTSRKMQYAGPYRG